MRWILGISMKRVKDEQIKIPREGKPSVTCLTSHTTSQGEYGPILENL
jgi:hypothetical protein